MSADSTWYPEAPKEQQDAEEVEHAKAVSSVPAVQDLLDWLEEFEAGCDHISSLGDVDSETDANYIKARLIINAEYKQKVASKAAQFRSQFSKYLDKQSG